MTTEYYLEEGDTHESLAKDLLEQAANPDQVTWAPRADTPGGGVYVLADEGIAQRVRAARADRRQEQARQIEEAQAAAQARDENPDVASGLATPAEAGFAANAGTDPGAAGAAKANAEATADDETSEDDEESADDAAADEAGEPRLTPAQKRARTREAKKQAEAEQAAADQEKSE